MEGGKNRLTAATLRLFLLLFLFHRRSTSRRFPVSSTPVVKGRRKKIVSFGFSREPVVAASCFLFQASLIEINSSAVITDYCAGKLRSPEL